MAAVLERVRRSGGSVPQGGVVESAGAFAARFLAERGITAHADSAAGLDWLIVSHRQDTTGFPDTRTASYVLLAVHGEEFEDYTVKRAATRPGDRWHVAYHSGTESPEAVSALGLWPAGEFGAVADWIARWIADPQG
ncbi:hypothetical protein AB0465_37445 [Streptomyces griseoviridis]|uniref:hypothetical protein n=1 Tax=Streptomyces griseoviridis TaxID=45398 RepID=UPI0033FCE6DD